MLCDSRRFSLTRPLISEKIKILTKNAKFATIISVLNIFDEFPRQFDRFRDFSQKKFDKKRQFA